MNAAPPYAVVVADAHLNGRNNEFDVFLAFLNSLTTSPLNVVCLLGDLFDLWLGAPKLQLSFQPPVIEALQQLRTQGKQIWYVEGNRDYFLTPSFLHAPFTRIASEALQERIGGRWCYFAHGDLINLHDRQYRLWRRFSRNRLIYAAFQGLPRAIALRFAQYLEVRFRSTNRKYKARFPAELCAAFARGIFETGCDAVILGHFHEQRQQEFLVEGVSKTLYALPAWKDTHTYLHITDDGAAAFRRFDEEEAASSV